MDPRPYHFDYRKPRLTNPTLYQLHNQANHLTSMKVCSQLKNLSLTNLSPNYAILKFTTGPFHNKTNLKCKQSLTQQTISFN